MRQSIPLIVAAFLAMSTGTSWALDCTVREYVCQVEPDEAKLLTHCCYTNKFGKEVHAPSKTLDCTPPMRAVAQCRDEAYSFSEHRRGTYSWHKGVLRRLRE
jgi:hypothetical protein